MLCLARLAKQTRLAAIKITQSLPENFTRAQPRLHRCGRRLCTERSLVYNDSKVRPNQDKGQDIVQFCKKLPYKDQEMSVSLEGIAKPISEFPLGGLLPKDITEVRGRTI